LSPENKFPVAWEDTISVWNWLTGPGGKKHNIDTSKVAIGGSSIGGNVAAQTALTLSKTPGAVQPIYVLLVNFFFLESCQSCLTPFLVLGLSRSR
jgi:acetyl esterase/lipase